MTIKVAVGQLCSSSNLSHNLRTVVKLLKLAQAHNSRILFLPEATDYLSRNATHSKQLSHNVQSQFLTPLLEQIKESNGKTYVSIGVHLPGQERVRNMHLLINPYGEIISSYQKVHLFDVDVPNGPILKESKSVEPGNEIAKPIDIDGFNIGLGICYDIRFPEFALSLRESGAHVLTYPSAFTTRTGTDHWELLSRGRAVDTQCFVINAAQCGTHDVNADGESQDSDVKRISYGESIIIDPWGKVLSRAKKYTDELIKDEEGDYYDIIYAELDIDSLTKVRKNMPVMQHRKPSVYSEN
ncbi:nitrilase superfamily protein [Spathaspora passalidarum NRRL Y-27907]|uniref:Nitrilase superfamily protein n=1 Tax=Spathaspora passalidarum (strain NRRL Y-27907 / 11-Y1) TaxID=619300 RepID=G3AJ74_SPAPN|nr:nitrilase superfamily protein [Spathaspora passalidarum NRRL Y-27907]EGW33832.1 nitrilase superfamily protein [Spathaspora passalidarum NRRL Y-27907]